MQFLAERKQILSYADVIPCFITRLHPERFQTDKRS